MDEFKLEVHRHRLQGISREMGIVLQRTAFSPNIKERRDFSCALVDHQGRLVSQAAHIPVHLGAIPAIMRSFLDEISTPQPDHGYLTNDPYQGGTHLPDITLIVPWFEQGKLKGFLLNRAHHTDIGGAQSGSMAPQTHIDDEGFRTGPRNVLRDHHLNVSSVDDLLEMSRTPEERVTDLEAQVASAHRGKERIQEWYKQIEDDSSEIFEGLIQYTETYTRRLIAELPNGTYRAKDVMDGDGIDTMDILLKVEMTVSGETIRFDFSDSADQVQGNINAPRAVTASSTYYIMQCLLPETVPVNEGVLRPIKIDTRSGSILDAKYPSAVAGGNVETSQRVVDLLLKAFSEAIPAEVPADSQGTMNNVTMGWDDHGRTDTYYETLGGGAGGGPDYGGVSGRQVHMTNTRNTPIEDFERTTPLLVEKLQLRNGSGGRGKHSGGDGLVKQWGALREVEIGLLSERRIHCPTGREGGFSGEPGVQWKIREDGTREQIKGKSVFTLKPGQSFRLETPGGGGWGETE